MRFAILAAGLLFFAVTSVPARDAEGGTLLSQTAEAVLAREFSSPKLSYLLLNSSGEVLAERWSPDEPISPGSLVKPFLAIAYGEQHGGRFPTVRCMGTKSRCWFPPGHGNLVLEEAIAQSCNAYFLALTADVDRRRAVQTFARYALAGPPAEASNEALVGLESAWKESPLALAKAYLQLEKAQQSEIEGRVVKGMIGSAERGTARAVDAALGKDAAMAKTGTASCSHTPRGAADGFTVVMYPAAQPRLLLLVRVHGVPGAEAAKVAAAMLRALGANAR